MKIGFFIQYLDVGTTKPEKDFREANINKVCKKIGDRVQKGDLLFEIETDKASIDYPSPVDGVIRELYFKAGEKWSYGGKETTPLGEMLIPALAEIACDDEIAGATINKDQNTKECDIIIPNQKHSVEKEGIIEKVPFITPLARKEAEERGLTEEEILQSIKDKSRIEKADIIALAEKKTKLPRAVPAARRLIEENGLDMYKIQGSGEDGAIMYEDVIAYLKSLTIQKESPVLNTQESEIILLKPPREWVTVAHNLEHLKIVDVSSKQDVSSRTPVAGGEMYCDLGDLLMFQKNFGIVFETIFGVRMRRWAPIALTITRLLMRDEFRILNGYWHVDQQNRNDDRVAIYTHVNLGIAYDPGELPKIDFAENKIKSQRLRILTLHQADTLSNKDFFVQLDSLMHRAELDYKLGGGRIKNLSLNDMKDHTFIFNNIGGAKHVRGYSILTPGISTIFNLGEIAEKTLFQVFFDHRMYDGTMITHFVNTFSQELKKIIKDITRECFQR